MENVSRRIVLFGIGGAAAASAAAALGGCSSQDDGAADSDQPEEVTQPIELWVPHDWDYPMLVDAELPFVHGVASGDPTDDAVVIWTRLTIPDPLMIESDRVETLWEVATDQTFETVVAQGGATTDASYDWTVKVDVTGLAAASTYWFRFSALGHLSPTGRTKTAKRFDDGAVTIAAVSCASWWSGHFNTYARIADRDDIDLVVHSGDHIYDYPDAEEWVRARHDRFDPEYVDFRRWRTAEEIGRRYALYYADPDFDALRGTHPMVIAWDNHDVSLDDDETIDPDAPKAAFWRWTATRPPAAEIVDGQLTPRDVGLEYRSLSYGDADIFVLDVRTHSTDDSILGPTQQKWLEAGLAASSTSKMAKRIIVSPLPVGRFEVAGNPVYKGWSDRDGDRDRLLAFLEDNKIEDNVFLSGDAHGAFIWDLPRDQTATGYDPQTGAGSVGVEFLANSVTRGGYDETIAGNNYNGTFDKDAEDDRANFDPLLTQAAAGGVGIADGLVASNASMHYANWTDHGYGLVTINAEETTLESWLVPHLIVSDVETLDATFSVSSGTDHAVRPD